MNPLVKLKEKLIIKPTVEEIERVAVVIKGEKKHKNIRGPKNKKEKEEEEDEAEEEPDEKEDDEEQKSINKPKVTIPLIIDETQKGYDRESLFKRLKEGKASTVFIKPIVEKSEEKIVFEPVVSEIKKAKKVDIKKPLIIENDSDSESEEIEFIMKPKEKLFEEEEEEGEEKKEEEIIPINLPKKKERLTKKLEKGIAVLGPETVLEIGDTDLTKRLPQKQPPVIVKVSNYYMNNREIFVNFINSLFEPYRIELESNKENISCDTIGKTNSNFSLLTHQKIVRDYINLYTPYRGLLLYHGLGSGKTASSIAIAEGMKDSKRVIIMTPASLRANYIEELKKAGDLLYKRNQYWEWFSTSDNEEHIKTISAILNLPLEFIRKNKGAWFINIRKKSNYDNLTDLEKKSLEKQLNEMISQKYTFINYNGLRSQLLSNLTSGFTKNIFDNSVVVIDEAHNLISRIVNKLKKEKYSGEDERRKKRGEEKENDNIFGENVPLNLATKLYYMLLRAKDARIVLLSGTPVINYPNEFAILFNILRGYIKTWKIHLTIKTSKKIDKEVLRQMLKGEKSLDYLDYSPSSKVLTITRNPFGFKNKIKLDTGYQGVSNNKKEPNGTIVFDTEFRSDEDFERKIIDILKRNDIDVVLDGIQTKNKKALPDDLDEFISRYINDSDKKLKNVDGLKRRILGLSSYFKSAQESLLPRYNKQLGVDYHIVRVPMSDFQFKIYESARYEERKTEKPKKQPNPGDIFKESTSTYRIFSRLFCNFVMPERPTPKDLRFEKGMKIIENVFKEDSIYEKMKELLRPGIKKVLDKIEDEEEQKKWEDDINNDLRSYVKELRIVQEKGNKQIFELPSLQKILAKIMRIDKISKINSDKIQAASKKIGDRLEAYQLQLELEEPRKEGQEEEKEDTENITHLFRQARQLEQAQDMNDENEGEVEGDEILNKLGGKEYKDRLDAAIKNLEDNSDEFLTPEALQTYSPKFLHILENIKEPEYQGLHLVYSQFRTAEGIGLFSAVLNKNGFTRFIIKKNITGVWQIDIPEIDEGKPTYALYTGTETSEEKEILRHIYNGEWNQIPDSIGNKLREKYHNNNMGEVIKVFMITSSGSEGINLKNTRYVHIMEPYWHPVRLEQVIGRARRICSHNDLPEALQTVEVFVYLMIFTPEQLSSDKAIELKRKDLSKSVPKMPFTSDQYLYEISEIKSNLTSQLTDAIKESAFDCYIYSNGKCVNFGDPTNNKFSYVPDYADQQNDATVQANKVAIEWVGKPIKLAGVQYVYRRMSKNLLNIYDVASYNAAIKDPSIIPLQVGTLEINDKGEQVFKQLVT
jgi:hypothetical protein